MIARLLKRASGPLVFLCMLGTVGFVGTSRVAVAGFSADHELGDNRLAAAVVDLEVGQITAPVHLGPLAPGDRQTMRFEVSNAGTLPLLVSVAARINGSGLSEALVVDLWSSDVCNSAVGAAIGDLPLANGEKLSICLAVGLPLDASNDAQNASTTYDLVFDGRHDVDRTPSGAGAG